MSYVCTKRVRLGNSEFLPGDTIPEELFAKGRASKLIAYGYIAESSADVSGVSAVSNGASGTLTVSIAGASEGETAVTISVNGEQLQTVVDIMKGNNATAVAAIADEVDESVLTLILSIDSRKGVKDAAQKQLSVISSLKEPNGKE